MLALDASAKNVIGPGGSRKLENSTWTGSALISCHPVQPPVDKPADEVEPSEDEYVHTPEAADTMSGYSNSPMLTNCAYRFLNGYQVTSSPTSKWCCVARA
jgi:hypothetical protein